jgi:acetyltransferase-like isoleucine patch superfamily enzyme
MINKVRNFHAANGSCITALELISRVMSRLRGAVIGARCGSKAIRIGPRTHIRGLSSISIGDGFDAADGLWLEAVTRAAGESYAPRIVIGKNVNISRWTHIAAVNYIEIGSGVLIGSKVLITDNHHGSYSGDRQSAPGLPPAMRPLASRGPVIIGPNAWIGDGVVIMPGCKVGQGSIIGANSVVTTDIPEFTIAVGVPARCIEKYDFVASKWTKVT